MMKKIFNSTFDQFIEKTIIDIHSKINSLDYNSILNNKNELITSITKEFEAGKLEVRFDKITYTKKTKDVWDNEGNPEKWNIYTYKIPFEGDESLLNYFSNNGRGTVSPYYIKDHIIIFESVNNDLKPNPLNINNRIEILKDMINNLNKEYEKFNKTLNETITHYLEHRERNLIAFEEFCNEHDLSEEEIKKMKFKLGALETLSQIISENYTCSGITRLFKKAGFPEIVHDGNTKRKFVCQTFENMQEESIEGFYKILRVLEVLCDPQEYLSNPELHETTLKKVNLVLSFYGFKFDDAGTLKQLENKQTTLKANNKINIAQNNDSKSEIFISHSSKDKTWVNKLYKKFEEKGLRTWYDDAELTIGDNLREKINEGLNKCDYGVVVLSKDFIGSFWTKKEYDSLFTLMEDGKLFPINHGLSKEELETFDKSLTNIIYRDTKKYSVDEIADEIWMKIRKNMDN